MYGLHFISLLSCFILVGMKIHTTINKIVIIYNILRYGPTVQRYLTGDRNHEMFSWVGTVEGGPRNDDEMTV